MPPVTLGFSYPSLVLFGYKLGEIQSGFSWTQEMVSKAYVDLLVPTPSIECIECFIFLCHNCNVKCFFTWRRVFLHFTFDIGFCV